MKKHNIMLLVTILIFSSIVICLVLLINKRIRTETLFAAIESKDYQKVERAIKGGASVNATKHPVVFDFLYQNNPTPLIEACTHGDKDIIELLVNSGADVNKKDPLTYSTPLLITVNNGHANRFEIALYLIENGANINALDSNKGLSGRSVLHRAMYIGDNLNDETIKDNFKLCKYLYENGVRMGSMGCTTLTWASEVGNYKMVEYLLQNGSEDIDAVNNAVRGETALVLATKELNIEIVKLLLQFGVNKTIADVNGKIALDYASESENNELVQLLS